ncbi:TPA: hypothetical protein ACLYG8_001106, partial [Streptococcus pneumoniae]
MDKKLDILDKVKEYLGNKTTQILDNQYKEFLKLNDIRRAFGISEKVLNNSFNFTSKEFNDLINNENYLFEYACRIREEWRKKCFNHSYRFLCSPIITDDFLNTKTLRSSQIEYKYERYLSKSSIGDRAVDGFVSFNTLTANGMSAIKLCLEILNSIFFKKKIDLLYSTGYYETRFLLNNLAKSGISCYEVSNCELDKDKFYNVFMMEPNRADLTLQKTDFKIVEYFVKYKNNSIKVVILDISYQGSNFKLVEFLEKFKFANVIIFVVRSLIKLDQMGLELTNGGIIEVFIPNHLRKLKNFIEEDFNKFRNSHGANLSLYEYCLLDNSLTLKNDWNYSDLVMKFTSNFYADIKDLFMENSDIEIIHEEGVPFVFLDLIGEGKKEYEMFFQWLNFFYKQLGITLYARNSFGFRNLTVEYFGIIGTERYIFKICPGVYKGLSYYLMKF